MPERKRESTARPTAGNDRPLRPGAPAPAAPMSRGDEAPPGTPGTGEDVCPECGGSGQSRGGRCPNCDGTGRITVGIGGG